MALWQFVQRNGTDDIGRNQHACYVAGMANQVSAKPDETSRSITLWQIGLLKLDDVTPSQAAALWQAKLLKPEHLGKLANSWLEKGLDQGSSELAVLALDPPTSVAAAGSSFEAALADMGVAFPMLVEEGVLVKLELYLRSMIEGRLAPMKAMNAINDLYYDRGEVRLSHPNTNAEDPENYLGRELGLEYLYTWYRELQDAETGSTLFYFNDLPRDQQLAKFQEEMIAEAKILHGHLCDMHPEICAARR